MKKEVKSIKEETAENKEKNCILREIDQSSIIKSDQDLY